MTPQQPPNDSSTPSEPGPASYPGLGAIAEEAARLLQAAQAASQGWAARAWGPGQAGERTAHHDGAECRVCPVCQGLALLHEHSPEVYAHVADALGALTAAVRSVVEHRTSGDVPPEHEPDEPLDVAVEPRPRSAMQRIDVS